MHFKHKCFPEYSDYSVISQYSETEATSDLWCLPVFAITQDGF